MGKVVWHLNLVMARWHITNKELAEALGKHPNTVSNLRRVKVMPRMSGADLERLCQALSKLSGADVGPADLLQE